MATRSRIGKITSKGITSIYCHWDGYPSNNGKLLAEHYTDPAKIDALLALGDISSLGPDIGVQHDFADRNPEVCHAFIRDRGDDADHFEPVDHPTTHDLFQYADQCGAEWIYLWDGSQWLYSAADPAIPDMARMSPLDARHYADQIRPGA